jgi:prepilin-type N-terminal cleavage/methylation domain-containing protein
VRPIAHRRSRGFTLAEVLVSIVVVGTALVVLSQGIALGVKTDAKAERQTMAAVVLDEVAARLKTGEIATDEDSEGTLDDVAPGYGYRVAMETPGDPPDFRVATITVIWGADERGEFAAGELTAERWIYEGTTEDEEGGVTKGPEVGSERR